MAHNLVRIDAERNVFRFYRLDIQPDLFGTVSLIREWGRIGQAGTVRVTTFADGAAAEAERTKVLVSKQLRGYRAVVTSGIGGS